MTVTQFTMVPATAPIVNAHDLHIAVLQDMGARLNRSLELAHRALYPEMYAALDEAAQAVVPAAASDWNEADCGAGDTHGPEDTFHSWVEASAHIFANGLDGLIPKLNITDDRFHLIPEPPPIFYIAEDDGSVGDLPFFTRATAEAACARRRAMWGGNYWPVQGKVEVD